jgi:hypothetical protein
MTKLTIIPNKIAADTADTTHHKTYSLQKDSIVRIKCANGNEVAWSAELLSCMIHTLGHHLSL